MALEASVDLALNLLTSLINEEIGLITGAGKEMRKLAGTYSSIRAVLEDAELRQPESQEIQSWLIRLKDILWEIDDILDECATHVSMVKCRSPLLGRYNLKEILFRHNIGTRIKEAREKLQAIDEDRKSFQLRQRDFEGPRQIVDARETTSLPPLHVFGREDEKAEIVDMLVNQVKDNHDISILPIIGVGGLGKTTLAQLVFKDKQVDEHFNKKMWVCVSDNFNIKDLVKAMIESPTGGSASDLELLDSLHHRLRGLLNNERYLLVLDDVWSDEQEKWSQLKNILSCGAPGSSIIVTTRLQKVAEIVGTLPTCNLKGLSEEHGWLLLKNRAFAPDEEEKYPNLKAIGKRIVKKCVGVPLAVSAVGGILRFKRTEKEWVHVEMSELWELPQETEIFPVLRLSYHHLPLELRQCFSYCAIFPKDEIIKKEELIFLWMAHGYISSSGRMEAEEVGEQVWKELILRSLFERYNSPLYVGANESIIMHDLVHDLAQSIQENKLPGVHQTGSMSTSAPNSKIREVNLRGEYVAFPRNTQTEMDISFVLKRYNRLRVFHASHTTIKNLPSSIGGLKHLRYLDLSWSNFCTLPDSLCNLWNLQVLKLCSCTKLVGLPKKMRYLKNLRHLFLESCYSLREMPPNMGELTSLRTLSFFVVGCYKGNRLEELGCLNLGGELKIRHLERVTSLEDGKKANLANKPNLRRLKLIWVVDNELNSREESDENILEALQPHPNLENVEIDGFRGKHLPHFMKESTLGNLVRIELINCRNLLDLPHLEGLPHLEELVLKELGIEYIVEDGNEEAPHFPSLKELKLLFLSNLKGLYKEKAGREMCPNLHRLLIANCPSLVFSAPVAFNKLEDLECGDTNLSPSLMLDNLRKLTVQFASNVTCIPGWLLERLTNLEELYLRHAHEHCLPADGLRGLSSLRHFYIWLSDSLKCLPSGWLQHNTTLECLSIYRCSELVELSEDIKHLHSLKSIDLVDLGKMVCIPQVIRHLSTLEHLTLDRLPQLTSLPCWLDDLTSLTELQIFDCPELKSLPSNIRGMTKLRRLSIYGCPHLERKYRKRDGEDWQNIAHIPKVFFDW